jgi:hypothetical protein
MCQNRKGPTAELRNDGKGGIDTTIRADSRLPFVLQRVYITFTILADGSLALSNIQHVK